MGSVSVYAYLVKTKTMRVTMDRQLWIWLVSRLVGILTKLWWMWSSQVKAVDMF